MGSLLVQFLIRRNAAQATYAPSQIPEPPLARFLFADTRIAWLWLLVRLYVGYQWIVAGLEKLTGTDYDFTSKSFGKPTAAGSWVFGPHTGAAIKGFAQGALAKAGGSTPSVQGWYASFLRDRVIPHARFQAYAISFGEALVGAGLILGVLTGIAAFFGVLMNFNYLLAGTVSTNPILGLLGILLVLAWRIAGYWGLDRWLLPLLGTPWTGRLRSAPAGTSPRAPKELPPERTPEGTAPA